MQQHTQGLSVNVCAILKTWEGCSAHIQPIGLLVGITAAGGHSRVHSQPWRGGGAYRRSAAAGRDDAVVRNRLPSESPAR